MHPVKHQFFLHINKAAFLSGQLLPCIPIHITRKSLIEPEIAYEFFVERDAWTWNRIAECQNRLFEKSGQDEANAKLIAASSMLFDALSGLVQLIGEEDLPYLMSGAAAFIFPSFYEGFGIPVLEAMACGTPVVASGIPALREVAGEAAYLVDPYSIENIAEGISRVLTDEHLQEDLKIRGLDRAGQFSWARCARATHEVLKNAII